MATVDTSALMSVQDASNMGISKLLALAAEGNAKIILRHNKPLAALMSVAQLETIQEAVEDLMDVAVAEGRIAAAPAGRQTLDEVLLAFGHTRDELRRHPAY